MQVLYVSVITYTAHIRNPHMLFYMCTYIKCTYDYRDATLIEGTDTVMIPLKIIVAGKEKLFHGCGVNKKQAKCAAAKLALKRLQLEK